MWTKLLNVHVIFIDLNLLLLCQYVLSCQYCNLIQCLKKSNLSPSFSLLFWVIFVSSCVNPSTNAHLQIESLDDGNYKEHRVS